VIEPAYSRERVEIELAPEHGYEHQHAIGGIGKSAEATADHILHAPRDGELEAGLVQRPLGLQQTYDLAHEKRVALALVREEPLRRDAAGGNVLQLTRVATAANCTELQVTDANSY